MFFCRHPWGRPTHTTSLGKRVSKRTSGEAACSTEPPARTARVTMCTVRAQQERDYSHGRHDRDHVVIGTSLSRPTCPVGNNALRCALFKLLFMDSIHVHRPWTLFLRGFQIWFSKLVGPKKKKIPGIWGVATWYQSLGT